MEQIIERYKNLSFENTSGAKIALDERVFVILIFEKKGLWQTTTPFPASARIITWLWHSLTMLHAVSVVTNEKKQLCDEISLKIYIKRQ